MFQRICIRLIRRLALSTPGPFCIAITTADNHVTRIEKIFIDPDGTVHTATHDH